MEKDFLLGFHDTGSRTLDLRNGLQSRFVAPGIHIDFHQVVVHLFGVSGIREFIEKAFEHRYRLGKRRVGCFVQTQGIVIECLFLHAQVVRA